MAETSSAKHPQAHAVIIVDTQARRPELGGFKRRAFFRWHCLHCGKSDHHGSQKMACFLRFWKYDDQFGDYNIHIYIHTCMHCIALHCITYIHSDVSFTMWNPRYFLETPYAFIRHPTKSYCLILLLETLQIPSQVYPKDIPMIPQLYPNISRYRNISQDFQFGIPIWRYLSAPPGIHTYYEGYPGYHRGGWRLRSGPEAGKRQKWKMPSKMITLVTSKKRGFTWFLLFSKGFMAISWFSWGCRWDIIGIQSTIYYRL